MTKQTILYRVDGGRVWGISMGHVNRALITASCLKKTHNVIFVMKNYMDGVNYVKEQGFKVETIKVEDDGDSSLIKLSEKYSPSIVVFDLYKNYYNKFFLHASANKIRTVVFDVIGSCAGKPDAIINETFVPQYSKYNFDKSETELYIGPKYFLIKQPPKRIRIKNKIQNIIVTMGGSDPSNLTLKVVKSLKSSKINYNYNIVLGPLMDDTNRQKIKKEVHGISNFMVYDAPKDLLKIIAKQDLVICSAGRTLYECAYLGRPTIITPSIDHEDITAQIYSNLTGNYNVGLWCNNSGEKILKQIKRYENYKFRQNIYKLSSSLMDVGAREKIVKIIVGS